jgi:hypothetical protein
MPLQYFDWTILDAGIDSPVIKDSSQVDVPSITLASTGIFSPGTTYNLHVKGRKLKNR